MKKCAYFECQNESTKKYCSSSCKQKAYRRRKKKSKVKGCICGNMFEPKTAKQKYCTNACKQKAHRQRQKPKIINNQMGKSDTSGLIRMDTITINDTKPNKFAFGNDAGIEFLRQLKAKPKPKTVMCGFDEDVVCPRPALSGFCGGMTAKLLKTGKHSQLEDRRAFVVYSTFAKPVLKNVKGERVLFWDNSGLGHFLSDKRQWHTAVYYCKFGRDWAISNEKSLGARQIRVESVKAKPGTKRKTVTEEFDFCI